MSRYFRLLVCLAALAVGSRADAGYIYWTTWYSGTEIWRADLDGSNPQALITDGTHTNGIEVDAAGGKLYWGRYTQGIRCANLDGSNVIPLYSHPSPWNLAVDSGHVYFNGGGSDTTKGVWRVDTDGTDALRLDSYSDESIDVDPVLGDVYYQVAYQLDSAFVRRVRTVPGDGSGQPNEITGNEPFLPGITVDPVHRKLYLCQRDGGGILRRCNLDGTDMETLATFEHELYNVELDLANNALYYCTFDGIIGKTDLDGQNNQILLSGLGTVYDIALLLEPQVIPEPAGLALAGLAGLIARKRRVL